jgi:hypothetical protein
MLLNLYKYKLKDGRSNFRVVTSLDTIQFDSQSSIRHVTWPIKSVVLNLFCAMGPFDSLAKIMDPFSEKCI